MSSVWGDFYKLREHFRVILIFTLTSILLLMKLSYAQEVMEDEVRISPLDNLYSIQELNHQGFTFGTYWIESYVVKAYSCSQDEISKPCLRDYIIISETPDLLTNVDTPTEKELIVFVEEAEQFKEGQRYQFLIQILDVKTTPQILNNIKLVYSKPVEILQEEQMKEENLAQSKQ